MIRLVPPVLTAAAIWAVSLAEGAAEDRAAAPKLAPDPVCAQTLDPGEPPAPGCPEPASAPSPTAH